MISLIKNMNLKDFVKHLSDHIITFKIQTNSLNKINDLFNRKYEDDNENVLFNPFICKKDHRGMD